MDSLKIQDAFDPYYVGRKRVPVSRDSKPQAVEHSRKSTPDDTRNVDAERPGNATEH